MPQETSLPQITSNLPSQSSKGVSYDKILGLIFLVIGIGLIVFSTVSIFLTLTGSSKPAQVFNIESPTINLPSSGNLELPEGIQLPPDLQSMNQNPAGFKLIPDEVYNSSLNIGLHYLLMMFIASSGAKFADIGIKLIKDIKVSIKENKIKPS